MLRISVAFRLAQELAERLVVSSNNLGNLLGAKIEI